MRLLNDNILIQLDPESDKVASGLLYKPAKACEHVFRTAKVLQVGPGKWAPGVANTRLPVGVEVGDGVCFIKFVATHTKNAQEVQKVLGSEQAIIKPEDILFIYNHSEPPEINQ